MMPVSIPEFSTLFKKKYPLEISFISYDILEETKSRAQEICARTTISTRNGSMTNGGKAEDYIPVAFESLAWALTGYLSSVSQGLPVFNDENMRKSISLLGGLCESFPEQFFNYLEEWKNAVAETANILYEKKSSDDFVIYEICDQFYLESDPAKKLIASLRSEGLIQ